MNNPETAEFVCGLEGTDVTLDPPSGPPLHLSHQIWVIVRKLSERSQPMTQQDVTDGLGLPFAAVKFLCSPKETPKPSRHIRQEQAAKPQPHVELAALKALKRFKCDVVPDLLAYQEGKQGEDSIIPGGYMTYIVWNKVPGEPLNAEEFWDQDPKSRQAIRDKFREAFPKLKKFGYLPRMSTMSKIIYDKATGDMHFSGFSRAGRTDTNEAWHNKYYVLFRLAKPPPETTDWAKDTIGWTW